MPAMLGIAASVWPHAACLYTAATSRQRVGAGFHLPVIGSLGVEGVPMAEAQSQQQITGKTA